MNKSMLAGIGIGVAAALGVAAVASLNVFERGPQYAQVVSATPIKETVKTPRQECRNVTVTHRRPVQDENRITGSVLGAVAGGVIGHQFGGGRGKDVATVVGALGGGYAGNQIQGSLQESDTYTSNLIETVKGYAKYEGSTLEKVAELRNQVAAATSPAEAMRASDELTRQVSGIFAVAESYPDLKASANFSQLQEELTNTENKIAYSRQLYNSVTSNYNVKLETFPSNVIAKMFSFKAAEFLETPEEEKAVPKVDFSGLGN